MITQTQMPHYGDQETAAAAWNRRAPVSVPCDCIGPDMGLPIGQRVEDWRIYGMPSALDPEVREEVIAFALSFEECNETRQQLEAMGHEELIVTAYWAMANYAQGQL